MRVEKKQTIVADHRYRNLYYGSAREAMHDFIAAFAASSGEAVHVILPAYIGISPKEGSGIFDPIADLERRGCISYSFYRLTRSLLIDFGDLCRKIKDACGQPFIVLRVNYFGFIDPQKDMVYSYVKRHGGFLLEDCAHAFFTYFRRSDNATDASFFSLHKQFPFPSGGMLRFADNCLLNGLNGLMRPPSEANPWVYDFGVISRIQQENFVTYLRRANQRPDLFIPLKTGIEYDVVPQSFPILLRVADRYDVYLKMNELGFGVTSLYHTLIDSIAQNEEFEDSRRISATILNLPVHQDVDQESANVLFDTLIRCVEESGAG